MSLTLQNFEALRQLVGSLCSEGKGWGRAKKDCAVRTQTQSCPQGRKGRGWPLRALQEGPGRGQAVCPPQLETLHPRSRGQSRQFTAYGPSSSVLCVSPASPSVKGTGILDTGLLGGQDKSAEPDRHQLHLPPLRGNTRTPPCCRHHPDRLWAQMPQHRSET